MGDELLQECEEIKKQLPISSYARPAWDLNVLGKAGFSKFGIDLEISSRIYIEKDEFYNPTPLFMLCSRKKIELKMNHLMKNWNILISPQGA